ncbi:MAG: HAD family phosphatase [Clostridia bacterium]|nr:HAD family phosphatase [Clostridia bacterium]
MKAVIFDMDGLMIDTERLYFDTERQLAKSFGKEVKDETLWKMMGRKPLECMQIYADDLGLALPVEEILKMRDDAFEQKLINEVVPMPGLFEMLHGLENRFRLAIATGSPARFVKIIMDRLKIESYFDVIQTSDEIINGKPDPEIYLKTIEKLNVTPGECLVLEDSSNGALAGKKAGCYVIAVPSEYTNKQDFSFADFRAFDLNEARQHIKIKFE